MAAQTLCRRSIRATFSEDARSGKISDADRRRCARARVHFVGRFCSEVVGSVAGRHSDRARAQRFLFPDRHLHHPERRFEFVVFDFPTLGGSRSPSAMISSSQQLALNRHVARLGKCRRCPRMESTPISGGAIVSDVMIIGQAPGPREPTLKRPFAHTAGQTLFRWFEQSCGMNEARVRSKIYFAE